MSIHGLIKRFHMDERGITGLETAIILIAFVVVASVFAYTVLSAGIFSAEKGKEAVHAGLATAQSSMTINGPVLARDTDADNEIEQIVFVVSNAIDGEAINLITTTDADSDGILSDEATRNHVLVVTYTDNTQRLTDITWTKTSIGKSDGDDMLEGGEKFELTIDLTGLSTALVKNSSFTLELKPEKGSVMVIERTTPPVIDAVMDLR